MMSEVAKTEAELTRVEQKLAVVKAKLKVPQEALPKITDDSVWKATYLEVEDLQRTEMYVSHLKDEIWVKIKSMIAEDESKPDCEVLQLRSLVTPK